MDYKEKTRQLAKLIEDSLFPLIDRDYVLYGLPYYNNIGDTLIWDGELEFLKKVPHKCVGVCGWNSYPNTELPENILILITGGGYFGDLWRNAMEASLKGIARNRNNKIIFLPATVYYQDSDLLASDIEYLSLFTDFTICARESVSYDFARANFKNDVLLVPDMAFYMNERFIERWHKKKAPKNVLYFKRADKECPEEEYAIPENDFETHDWLPIEQDLRAERWVYKLLKRTGHFYRFGKDEPLKAQTWIYRNIYRRLMTRLGVQQLSSYNKIYTTRLHAMILGVMLGREVIMVDNKFNKLSAFYNTWLRDCDNVYPIG